MFTPQFKGTLLEAVITWTKPDGQSLVIYVGSPQPNDIYDVTDPSIAQWIHQFIQAQTGELQATVTAGDELNALFHQDGPNLLTNPVLHGTYHVRFDLVSQSPVYGAGRRLPPLMWNSRFPLYGVDKARIFTYIPFPVYQGALAERQARKVTGLRGV